MNEMVKFRQRIGDEWHYWGYGIQNFPESFISPMQSSNGNIYPSYQYIGLKDKNGTEIYDGDIIAYLGTLHVISFGWGLDNEDYGDSYGWCMSDNEFGKVRKSVIGSSSGVEKEFEIVDNITANKDLAKWVV